MKEIKLKPRFTDSRFDGYDQVDGDTYDNDGQTYSFIEKSAYDELVRERDTYRTDYIEFRRLHLQVKEERDELARANEILRTDARNDDDIIARYQKVLERIATRMNGDTDWYLAGIAKEALSDLSKSGTEDSK